MLKAYGLMPSRLEGEARTQRRALGSCRPHCAGRDRAADSRGDSARPVIEGHWGAGMKLNCESVARTALGEPARRAGRELLWHCPNHDDKHPSLVVDPAKSVGICGPCGQSGKAWELAAFLAGLDPGDKPGVMAWLKLHNLLSSRSDGRPRGEEGREAIR